MENQSPNSVSFPSTNEDDRLWAALGYIFNPLIPIATLVIEDKKDQPYLRYNAIVAITWTVISILLSLLLVGWCLAPIGNIVLAVMAFQGKPLEIPFLTNMYKQQGWIK